MKLTVLAIILVLITILVHAIGSTWWVGRLIKRYTNRDGTWKSANLLMIWVSNAAVLLLLHFVEILIWAFSYLLLPGLGQFESLEEALYFSIVTFTTLGYGDITLEPQWRILSGVEAMNGILLFGWSTALLFLVVQRSWSLAYSGRGNKQASGM